MSSEEELLREQMRKNALAKKTSAAKKSSIVPRKRSQNNEESPREPRTRSNIQNESNGIGFEQAKWAVWNQYCGLIGSILNHPGAFTGRLRDLNTLLQYFGLPKFTTQEQYRHYKTTGQMPETTRSDQNGE